MVEGLQCGTITWFVMDDGDLQFWMKNDGPLTIEQMVEEMEKLCETKSASVLAS